MQVKQWFAIGAVALAGNAVLAAPMPDNNGPLTRAEVRQSVIAARAAGQLVPAGEAAEYSTPQPAAPSTLTRAEVRQEVLDASAAGELTPAGEGDDEYFPRPGPTTSRLTRADVKAATLRARDAGELVPAGQADGASLARDRAQDKYARTAWLARKSAQVDRTGN